MTIIRFPPSVNLTGMATPLPWWKLLWRRTFGTRRRASRATIILNKVRKDYGRGY